MKKIKIFATTLCVFFAASLTFYSLNAQDPDPNESECLPEATITCNQHSGIGAMCWEYSWRSSICYFTGRQQSMCLPWY
jgi:hypothetical protein